MNKSFPPQRQGKPGSQEKMAPQPLTLGQWYKGSGKLKNKVALVCGGDSGIGRAVSIFFAREGADIAISYLNEHKDARQTKKDVEKEGSRCVLLPGDISRPQKCAEVVERTIKGLASLDILVNNAVYQEYQTELESLDEKQLEKTFRTNIFSYFYMTKEALKYIPDQTGVIINTSSVTAYKGSTHVLDYSSTKGAIVAFTRSLALTLVKRGIRVNAVAPGPIWTPLIISSYPEEAIPEFGKDTPMGRAGHPEEVAPAYVFLASRDSSFITGQAIHPNGGIPVES